MADEATRRILSGIPLLRTNAGPRDAERWRERLKEEYQALIKVKAAGVGEGRRWTAGVAVSQRHGSNLRVDFRSGGATSGLSGCRRQLCPGGPSL
ncbi:hypothetical protein chiPu_0025594 [Chiloscyllium punctatum]|uniref:Ubiquitin-fold modifier-conjugating enzyme 1 n=1 Tax=Chiloscyllium punctatum TaxID=137246 RepID=A0A401TGI7_CHIPU|nr:hypothetical protein [Chiloscyllium punctatum]